jgi:hypothetical protein
MARDWILMVDNRLAWIVVTAAQVRCLGGKRVSFS